MSLRSAEMTTFEQTSTNVSARPMDIGMVTVLGTFIRAGAEAAVLFRCAAVLRAFPTSSDHLS